MPKRIFYSLKPAKSTYKQPNTVYLCVKTDFFGEFLAGAAVSEGGEFINLHTPAQVVDYIKCLKSNTWVITFNAAYIACLIPEAIKQFKKIDGYGSASYITTFQNKNYKVFLIDIYPFFLKPLRELEDPGKSCTSELISITKIWKRYRSIIRSAFGVHPSKAPGSTALKTWKTKINSSYTSKGKRIGKFSKEACTFGALHWERGHYPQAYYYDINASYLSVMRTMRYPVQLMSFADQAPPTNKWIALANVSYNTHFRFSPLNINVKEDGRNVVYHPTEAQQVRVRLTYIDYLLLRQYGDLKIHEWLEGVYWKDADEHDLFSEWVNAIETASAHPQIKAYLKPTSRALHSKFAQGNMPLIEIVRMSNKKMDLTKSNILDIYPFDGGQAVKIERQQKPIFKPYYRPDWEALTLSAARLVIYDAINADTIYVDTDSIISTSERNDLHIGDKFGDWKKQAQGECWIAGARYYAIGERTKASGVRAENAEALRAAVIDAVEGHSAAVSAIRNPSLRNSQIKQQHYLHRFRSIKYPHVVVQGRRAFVTRSPTVQKKIAYQHRIIS